MKKTYVGIDLFKLICAFLIVFMHTFCFDSNIGLWIKNYLSIIGVPFFFIASGFFFYRGLEKAIDKKSYFYKHQKRTLIMYTAWTIITIPVAYYNLCLAHPDYSLLLKGIYILRGYFLSGSIGIYWFLLALIYNCSILYLVYKFKKTNLPIFLFSLIFFIIGILYNGGVLNSTNLGDFIHVIFGSERNFLNIGLFYMYLGFIIAKKDFNVNLFYSSLLTCTFIILDSHYSKIIGVHFLHAFSAIFVFLMSKELLLNHLKPISLQMREYSIALYLGHFPFILVFDYYLKRGTLIDFISAILFSVALYWIIKKFTTETIVKALYG